MKRPNFIARQSSMPTGLLGRFIAGIMARETAALNRRAVELLEVQPQDRVLEVGFGHGRTVEQLAALATQGLVAGVDVSETMQEVASRRNRQAISERRVDLRTGDAVALPFEPATFDKALCVHTLYFWAEPDRSLRELRRVMKPPAKLVLGFTPSSSARVGQFPAGIYRFYSDDEVAALLAEAGFGRINLMQAGDVTLAVCGGA
jgi:ubiquinone/menaquinone biosynthesis C-methylase UbiE